MLSYECGNLLLINEVFKDNCLFCLQIWQSTIHSLLELSVVHIIMITMDTNTTVVKWSVPILAMLAGLCRDRLYQFCNKVYFLVTLLISSWTDKKQRRGSTIPIIVVSVILFPLILGVIAIASALSVPLLPLFTLPVVFFSFPRPLRSWPEEVGASANVCPDTNFYKQLVPGLSQAFSTAFANGSLGNCSWFLELLMNITIRKNAIL